MVAGYYVSSDARLLDIDVVHGFLSQSYWAKGIPLATLQRAIDNSLCFGVYAASGEQVGFARMITDRATFVYLADVFVLPAHRGLGLSKLLMSEIVAHADLQGLRRMALATSDAHGLYQQFGFTPLNRANTFMELWQPNVYQSA
ncbi:GNAT family N-acetyltransferase [Shewanella sp.]|uniref:GNAT family N-acetyltransferase n=1 Tax=Shewanella sp. TaxID=50422 RepID=UPI003A981627